MKKSRIASPVPHPESSLRHLPLVDLLVDTKTELGPATKGSTSSVLTLLGMRRWHDRRRKGISLARA